MAQSGRTIAIVSNASRHCIASDNESEMDRKQKNNNEDRPRACYRKQDGKQE